MLKKAQEVQPHLDSVKSSATTPHFPYETLDKKTTHTLQERIPPQSTKAITSTQTANEYAELKLLMKQHGLLEKQPVYYTLKIASLFVLFGLSIAFLVVIGPSWFQLLNAAFLAFVSTQLGLLGHDAGHRQIFRKTWKNDVVGLITGDLLMGLSQEWWMDKHNRHHSHPNQHDMDPDIDIPILSFDGEDLASKGKFARFIIKRQAWFFFPLLLLVGIDLQKSSILFLLHSKEKLHRTEIALMLLHYLGYFSLVFLCLGPWLAIPFILIHQTLSGLYLGSIFAPNHKGMPQLEKDCSMNFLRRQIVTSRNVYGHPITDFVYGGLNYQIEHHLFPSMPRRNLRAAQQLVKQFCQERSIPYHETGVLRSYQEILQHLHLISVSFRQSNV